MICFVAYGRVQNVITEKVVPQNNDFWSFIQAIFNLIKIYIGRVSNLIILFNLTSLCCSDNYQWIYQWSQDQCVLMNCPKLSTKLSWIVSSLTFWYWIVSLLIFWYCAKGWTTRVAFGVQPDRFWIVVFFYILLTKRSFLIQKMTQ